MIGRDLFVLSSFCLLVPVLGACGDEQSAAPVDSVAEDGHEEELVVPDVPRRADMHGPENTFQDMAADTPKDEEGPDSPDAVSSADAHADLGCVPDCASKDCGTDGCGGECGTCDGGDYCVAACMDGVCSETASEICNDGTDNDCDALVDYQDGDCPELAKRIGLGHALAISLKDEYRSQVIPIAAASGARYTALYLTRTTAIGDGTGEDGSFMDSNVQAFVNYDAGQGYNQAWWNRFAAYLQQCQAYGITVIPSLYDFCCSGGGPFFGYNNFDSYDENYVTKVVGYLDDSGVDYIINIGVEKGPGGGMGPSAAFLNSCISHLMGLGVSLSEEMCISDELLDEHYGANDIVNIPGYVTDHGDYIPGDTAGHGHWSGNADHSMNDEEKRAKHGYPVECAGSLGSGWGGSGTTSSYKSYLNQVSGNAVACMNFWHLKAFNNCQNAVGGEDMNAIFAPNQRAAILETLAQP